MTKKEKSQYQLNWSRNNRDKVRGYRAARRAKIKAIAWAVKVNGKCAHCDESDPICLDFHHTEDNKSFDIARELGRGFIAIDRLMAELAKCELLCANCHRKEHREKFTPKISVTEGAE